MRQLTSLDAQFLALENARQTGHVGSLAMLDPATAPDGSFGCHEVTRLISERGTQLPPLRWRLAEVPLGLDHPYWVEEAEIDLGYHVREMALASPVKVVDGSIFAVPPATKHAFKAAGTDPTLAIQVYSPPGPEQRFKKLAEGK